MRDLFIAVGAVLAVALVLIVVRRRQRAETPFPKLLEILQTEAVSIAKDSYGITLDYSPASIEKVEEILGKLHAEYDKRKTTEGQRGFALAFGAYIGEVIRRETGEGHWERNHPQIGEGSMPFYWKSGAAFPVAWCLKRLASGDEDNVWLKYRVLVHEKLQKRD